MKTWHHFLIAIFATAFLTGCGSSSSPSKNEVEKAVRTYVGLGRPDAGDVKVDALKIFNEAQKKIGDDDVFTRQFEARYTVTHGNNPSKHSFEGTIAIIKQGQKWVLRQDLCALTFIDSPPIIDAATQAAMDRQAKLNANDPNFREEPNQNISKPPAKESTGQK